MAVRKKRAVSVLDLGEIVYWPAWEHTGREEVQILCVCGGKSRKLAFDGSDQRRLDDLTTLTAACPHCEMHLIATILLYSKGNPMWCGHRYKLPASTSIIITLESLYDLINSDDEVSGEEAGKC